MPLQKHRLLLPANNDNQIKDNLHLFILYRQDHPSDKYSSLAVTIRQNIHIAEQEYFATINGLKLTVINITTTLVSKTIHRFDTVHS